jgi:hypothetical protein
VARIKIPHHRLHHRTLLLPLLALIKISYTHLHFPTPCAYQNPYTLAYISPPPYAPTCPARPTATRLLDAQPRPVTLVIPRFDVPARLLQHFDQQDPVMTVLWTWK